MKDLKIVEEKENKLLNRIEIVAEIDHEGERTPSREEVRKRIAAIKGVNEEQVIVHSIKSIFGAPISRAVIRIYNSKDDLLKIEPKYLLKRNGFIQEGES